MGTPSSLALRDANENEGEFRERIHRIKRRTYFPAEIFCLFKGCIRGLSILQNTTTPCNYGC